MGHKKESPKQILDRLRWQSELRNGVKKMFMKPQVYDTIMKGEEEVKRFVCGGCGSLRNEPRSVRYTYPWSGKKLQYGMYIGSGCDECYQRARRNIINHLDKQGVEAE